MDGSREQSGLIFFSIVVVPYRQDPHNPVGTLRARKASIFCQSEHPLCWKPRPHMTPWNPPPTPRVEKTNPFPPRAAGKLLSSQ